LVALHDADIDDSSSGVQEPNNILFDFELDRGHFKGPGVVDEDLCWDWVAWEV
jgi:hypothetical protein